MSIIPQKLKALVRESWAVSWPMTLIMLYEFILGITDVFIAGKFGKEVQAAYGLAFQMYFIFIVIALALVVGVVSVISRLFTSGNKAEFNSAVYSSLVAAVTTGMIFATAGILLSGPIISTFKIPAPIKFYAVIFLITYSMGFLFDYILVVTNGILRACNMIRHSLVTMTIVCIMNVALNFWLALNTPMGYRGIAASTVISLFVGCLLNMQFMRRLVSGSMKFSWNAIKSVIDIAWPSGVLQILWNIGAMVLFLILSMVPAHNVEIMAAFTNGLRIESAIYLPAIAFNLAAAVIVGNSMGKKENESAYHGGIVTAWLGVMVTIILTLAVMVNARPVAGFLSGNSMVADESVKYIYIALLSEPVMAWGVILSGALQGAGDTRSVMVIITLAIWMIRLPLSYIFGIYFGMGAAAVWWAMNISVFAQTVFITRRYFSRKWLSNVYVSE
jgi:MATE family multidrug resistance protein